MKEAKQDIVTKQKEEAHFFRMKRKGNGWLIQELTVDRMGKMTIKDLGDWDMRDIVERKLISEANKYAR